jgi:DNA-binding transcriptional LysR family regulator
VTRLAGELTAERPLLQIRLDEDLSPELLHSVATHELAVAAVFASPRAAERHGVRIDVLRDEPLLAALPATHRYANEAAIPIGAFVAECVLLPRDPVGRGFTAWFRAVLRASGFELGETRETLSAPWDRRMVPVADGETVSVFVRDWAEEARPRVVAVPFDPPLSFPIDLASAVPPTEGSGQLVETALRLRDDEGWLAHRPASTELPGD